MQVEASATTKDAVMAVLQAAEDPITIHAIHKAIKHTGASLIAVRGTMYRFRLMGVVVEVGQEPRTEDQPRFGRPRKLWALA